MQISGRNFKSLEGLRGYMAWTVVLFHILQYSGIDGDPNWQWLAFALNGNAAVGVFIIVSGFVITHLLLARTEPYRHYLTRRALRIIPIYYLCLLLALLTLVAQRHFSLEMSILDRPSWDGRNAAFIADLPEHIVWHLTLLHGIVPDNWLPGASWSILGPAWSLSLEWQFYLLAPFIVLLIRRSLLSAVVCIGVLLAIHMGLHRQTFLIWRFPSFLPSAIQFFLLGILCRLGLPLLAQLRIWTVPLAGIAAALVFRSLTYELCVWTVFFTAVLKEMKYPTSTLSGLGWISRTLDGVTQNRLILILGRSSYATYLVHIPLFAGITLLGEVALGWHGRQTLALLCAGSLPLLAILSIGLYQYVEAPFIRLGSRLTATRPVVPTEVKT